MTENDDQVFDRENIEQLFDDSDPNTWTATEELATLPTAIFKKNTLSQATRKSILQSEPRNKAISFEPPIMDRKIWSAMSRNAKENDKNLRRIVYRFSSVVRPIDNTLRLVYASKPEDESGEAYNAWVLLEQTVLNNRALESFCFFFFFSFFSRFSFTFRVRNGKIAKFWLFSDANY